MTQVTLVRHGQANSNLLDYDQLSPLGQQQMHCLADFYRAHWANPARHSGTLQRHLQSDAALTEILGESHTTQSNPAWNEFDFLDIVSQYRPEWQDPESLKYSIANEPDARRVFLREFRKALGVWMSAETTEAKENYKETWPAFNQRIRDALLSLDPDHSHWVITSGGVISALIGQALGLNADGVIKLNFSLNNASVTEVSIKGDRIHLNSFNQVQHFYGKDIFLSYF